MDEKLIRAFVEVVEQGTVSDAAHSLDISQPALSRQLQKFQQLIGLEVFRREGIHLKITAAGEQLLPYAKHLLDEHEKFRRYSKVLASGRLHEISLAAPGTTLIDVVIPFVATLDPQEFKATVSEAELDASMLTLVNRFDLAVMPFTPHEDIDSLKILEVPVWAYVSGQHPWAGRDEITIAELVTQPVVAPSRNFKSRRVLDAAMDAESVAPRQFTETNSGRVAQALVATGRGVAVAGEDTEFGLKALRISHAGKHMQTELHAAWRRDHYAYQTIVELAQRLRTFAQQRYAVDS